MKQLVRQISMWYQSHGQRIEKTIQHLLTTHSAHSAPAHIRRCLPNSPRRLSRGCINETLPYVYFVDSLCCQAVWLGPCKQLMGVAQRLQSLGWTKVSPLRAMHTTMCYGPFRPPWPCMGMIFGTRAQPRVTSSTFSDDFRKMDPCKPPSCMGAWVGGLHGCMGPFSENGTMQDGGLHGSSPL